MERMLSWRLRLTASASQVDFCRVFETSWFDGVTFLCSLNQAIPSHFYWVLWVPELMMLFYLLFLLLLFTIYSWYLCLLYSCSKPKVQLWMYIIHRQLKMHIKYPSMKMFPKLKNTLHWPFSFTFQDTSAILWVWASLSVWVLKSDRGKRLRCNQLSVDV